MGEDFGKQTEVLKLAEIRESVISELDVQNHEIYLVSSYPNKTLESDYFEFEKFLNDLFDFVTKTSMHNSVLLLIFVFHEHSFEVLQTLDFQTDRKLVNEIFMFLKESVHYEEQHDKLYSKVIVKNKGDILAFCADKGVRDIAIDFLADYQYLINRKEMSKEFRNGEIMVSIFN